MNTVLSMMAMGSFLAERLRGGDDAVQRMAKMEAQQNGASASLVLYQLEWARAWHSNGYPRVVLAHKHAASLMATQTNPESIRDARAPWDAFLVDVPDGLLVTANGRPVTVAAMRVGRFSKVSAYAPSLNPADRTIGLDFGDRNGFFGAVAAATIADLGTFQDYAPHVELLARLVLGVCMEMTSTTYKGERLGPRPVKRDPRTGEPRTWTFQLTRDVKVDCRDAVRAYSRGETHASPTVQTLVRGHWKQQVCGKGGAERKNIFVEPYWRGPEEAHIALRKHVVASDETSEEVSRG